MRHEVFVLTVEGFPQTTEVGGAEIGTETCRVGETEKEKGVDLFGMDKKYWVKYSTRTTRVLFWWEGRSS